MFRNKVANRPLFTFKEMISTTKSGQLREWWSVGKHVPSCTFLTHTNKSLTLTGPVDFAFGQLLLPQIVLPQRVHFSCSARLVTLLIGRHNCYSLAVCTVCQFPSICQPKAFVVRSFGEWWWWWLQFPSP